MNGPIIVKKRKLNGTWNKHLDRFMKRKANKKLRKIPLDEL